MSNGLAGAMAHLWQRIKGTPKRRYELLPLTEKEDLKYRKQSPSSFRRVTVYLVALTVILSLYGFFR